MKTRWYAFTVLTVVLGFAGCANQPELTQKEKDRMAREMERESRKQTQAQEKMMRGNTRDGISGQRTGSR